MLGRDTYGQGVSESAGIAAKLDDLSSIPSTHTYTGRTDGLEILRRDKNLSCQFVITTLRSQARVYGERAKNKRMPETELIVLPRLWPSHPILQNIKWPVNGPNPTQFSSTKNTD